MKHVFVFAMTALSSPVLHAQSSDAELMQQWLERACVDDASISSKLNYCSCYKDKKEEFEKLQKSFASEDEYRQKKLEARNKLRMAMVAKKLSKVLSNVYS